MSNLVWCTDVHLNFVNEAGIADFADMILSYDPDAIVFTGDISEAPDLELHLRYLEMHLNNVPLYFVCGNHDYYKGSIMGVRKFLKSRFTASGPTRWLPTQGVVTLAPDVALVGHDGWYDGGYSAHGDWFKSKLNMSDYHLIHDLNNVACSTRREQYSRINALSKEGADHFKKYLPKAFKSHNKVYFATHVAPFPENSRAPNGAMSDANWHPHFCSRQLGEAILETMKKMPTEKELIVLCGHNHTKAVFKPLPNVTCITGQARYKFPSVADVFTD
jgi:predicted MPP superfamily phosphohydrolase